MSASLPTSRAIRLVVRREFRAQVMRRSFVISNAFMLLLIVGGIVGLALFGGSDDRPVVGVTDPALATAVTAAGQRLGHPVDIRPLDGLAAGRDRVRAGDLDVALAPANDGTAGARAVVDSELPSTMHAVLDAALAERASRAAMTATGIDPAAVAAATPPAALAVDAIDPADPQAGQRAALSFAVLIVMFTQILVFGIAVAMGVVEEKSSRVVEVLLSTIRPLHLLWGKILGIGAVGLMQLAIYGVAGIGAGLATGVLTVTGTALSVLGFALAWFVLGYGFFAVLYAAAGSLVSRVEDVNTTTGPLMMVLLAVYGAGFWYLGSPQGTVVNALAWIPPFPAILMPLKVADGTAGLVQIVVSAALMLASITVLAWAGSRIYERSVLRIGAAVPWREAMRRT